ncbi:MAG: hypothetical protein AB7O96_14535 [Pseudobdellovibrionaceae bacterium]
MNLILIIALAFVGMAWPQQAFGLKEKKTMKLEITKVYRTTMFVNMAKDYPTQFNLAKPQKIVLNETVDKLEKQDKSIIVAPPRSYEVTVSALKNGRVTISPNSTSAKESLDWIKFNSAGVAGSPHKFKEPIELKDDDVIEIYRAVNSDEVDYEVSFRMKLVSAK